MKTENKETKKEKFIKPGWENIPSESWRNIKKKIFGNYHVRKRNNSYYGELIDEHGVVKNRFDVWKSEELDRAFENGDINPFISESQKQSQIGKRKQATFQHKSMLKNIQRRFKKHYGKTLTLNSIKKSIARHSESQARRYEIEEALKDIREEDIKKKYEGAEYYAKEGNDYAKLKDGIVLKFDNTLHDGDSLVKAIPDDVTMEELWELYGDKTVESKIEKD